MGELDLDKIERTFPSFNEKKTDPESVRISTGRMRPGHTRMKRRNLTKDARKSVRLDHTF